MATKATRVTATGKPKSIVERCPICNKESIREYTEKAESVYRFYTIRMGVDVTERREGKVYVYVPCSEHKDAFEEKVKGYLRLYEKARSAYKSMVSKELGKLRSRIIDDALKKLRNMVEGLKEGEGLIFWVCEGSYRDSDVVREVVAMVVKEGGKAKTIYGSTTKPLVAYKTGSEYAQTHYDAQDMMIYLDTHGNVKWTAYVQGLVISGKEDIGRLLKAIFHLTHFEPQWTLVDFLANRLNLHGLYVSDLNEVVSRASGKENPEWILASKKPVEEKVRQEIIEKYGIDPTRRPHAKDVFGIS
jgi:hypothetical protein